MRKMLTAAALAALTAVMTPSAASGQDEAVQAAELAAETVFWQSVADSANPADFEAYLEQWPEGVFARLARTRLAELELGDADAQFNLGEKYYNGDGVDRDHAEAVRWYRLAAEQGHFEAQYALGSMYASLTDDGRRLRDADEAVRWWRLAAEQGHFEAQARLGSLYYFGDGVEEDDAEAVRWYRLAAEQAEQAEQDNAYLWHRLGQMYEYGRGVEEDAEEAVRWYRLAAEQGSADAQSALDRLQGR